MRQSHVGGEKVFVDFAGDTIGVTDPDSGVVWQARLFVATMGPSNLVFAEARASEGLADWIGAHVSLFAALGGVPKFVVCDNLKSAVISADRYEPGLNRSYLELAEHYGTTILPARPGKPRDKAKVEQSVLLAERWILARLRHARFFSLAELNGAITTLTADLNARIMRGFGASRAELFAALDAPALRGLPERAYAFARWKRCRVGPDYHVEGEGHWYSVPFRLIRQVLDVRGGRGHGRGLPSRRAGGQPPAGAAAARPQHRARAHAERASPARPVDARPPAGGGGPDRPRHGGAVRGGDGGALASRAGLPHLPRHPGPGQEPIEPPGSTPPAGAAPASGRARWPRSAPFCRTASSGPSWRRRRSGGLPRCTATSVAGATSTDPRQKGPHACPPHPGAADRARPDRHGRGARQPAALA